MDAPLVSILHLLLCPCNASSSSSGLADDLTLPRWQLLSEEGPSESVFSSSGTLILRPVFLHAMHGPLNSGATPLASGVYSLKVSAAVGYAASAHHLPYTLKAMVQVMNKVLARLSVNVPSDVLSTLQMWALHASLDDRFTCLGSSLDALSLTLATATKSQAAEAVLKAVMSVEAVERLINLVLSNLGHLENAVIASIIRECVSQLVTLIEASPNALSLYLGGSPLHNWSCFQILIQMFPPPADPRSFESLTDMPLLVDWMSNRSESMLLDSVGSILADSSLGPLHADILNLIRSLASIGTCLHGC